MSDWLVYWKHYWDDVEKFSPDLFTLDWHTNRDWFIDKLKPGDNLWIVTTHGFDSDEWRLLERLNIIKLDFDPDPDYGDYHARGDLSKSSFFNLDSQNNLIKILHKLEFISGKSIPKYISGKRIGIYLQNIRQLSVNDISILNDYSNSIMNQEPVLFDR